MSCYARHVVTHNLYPGEELDAVREGTSQATAAPGNLPNPVATGAADIEELRVEIADLRRRVQDLEEILRAHRG